MKLFARHLIRWQWMVVVLLVGMTGVALAGMTRLRVDPSNERLFPRQGDDARVYQRFLTTFGSDEDILVAVPLRARGPGCCTALDPGPG